MAKSEFYSKIEGSTNEQMVANVYNEYLMKWFNVNRIEYPHDCDGVVENDKVKLIIEYKHDKDLNNPTERAKVLAQVVYYLKRFDECGELMPNVCLVGDVNECFVMHTNELLKYLDEDYDWSLAPSTVYIYNSDIVSKISKDSSINPFVFDVNDNFKFNAVVKQINVATGVARYTRITEHNMLAAFDYFKKNVVKDKSVTSHELVSIFIGVLTNPSRYLKHPVEHNTLIVPNRAEWVKIDANKFDAFFSRYHREYTPKETERFTEISDRLIDDVDRRKGGEFYTPTLFVDYAHKMISEKFGDDWKEKYVVWDNCCGTKNHTRDYKFKELYCSTIENAELEIGSRYNKEAVSFQFDFLNDSLDKLPIGLKKALEENKPIIFFINPPYATPSNHGNSTKGKGATDTTISKKMVAKKLGNASNNSYAQFLYRIAEIKKAYNLTDCHIALFCKPTYISGTGYESFRKEFFEDFNYSNGVLFNASEFSDVSDKWGIHFAIWDGGECVNKTEFEHTLISNKDGEIVEGEKKIIYNADGLTTAKKWVKEPIEGIGVVEKPTMSSALVIKEGKNSRTKIAENAIGCYFKVGNNISTNQQYVAIFTSADSSNSNGTSILPQNFGRVCASFASRKLIVGNWINDKDEYIAPNTENEKYKEFENDSVVYSLFNSSSNQSSLRNVDYKGKKWDIKNEFFFMSKDEMSKLANKNGNDDCYNDCRVSEDRYVYKYLKGLELSEEAKNVLDKAIEIVRKTFKYRKEFNTIHPEYQINNWDCGWYQIKALAKEYCEKDLNEFKELYNKLADKMRPMVYELGFLK